MNRKWWSRPSLAKSTMSHCSVEKTKPRQASAKCAKQGSSVKILLTLSTSRTQQEEHRVIKKASSLEQEETKPRSLWQRITTTLNLWICSIMKSVEEVGCQRSDSVIELSSMWVACTQKTKFSRMLIHSTVERTCSKQTSVSLSWAITTSTMWRAVTSSAPNFTNWIYLSLTRGLKWEPSCQSRIVITYNSWAKSSNLIRLYRYHTSNDTQ